MKKISEFKESLWQGIAKTSLMDVVITPPPTLKGESAEFLRLKCESADLPGKTFGVDVRTDYVTSSKHPYGVTFTDLNLTFICSSTMSERKFFDHWMETIIGTKDSKSSYYNSFVSESIKVNLYTGRNEDEKSCTFTFKKIFPTTLTAQNVSWTEDNALKLTVSFAYEYWTVEYFKVQKYEK